MAVIVAEALVSVRVEAPRAQVHQSVKPLEHVEQGDYEENGRQGQDTVRGVVLTQVDLGEADADVSCKGDQPGTPDRDVIEAAQVEDPRVRRTAHVNERGRGYYHRRWQPAALFDPDESQRSRRLEICRTLPVE